MSVSTSRWQLRARSWGLTLLGLTAVLVVFAYWLWREGAEHRAVVQLEAESRRGAYLSTEEAFERLCSPPVKAGLEARCREEAAFLLEFPECQEHCRSLAEPFVRHRPTK